MNKTYFFTDIDLLQTQSVSDTFGPILSTDIDFIPGNDCFRVSSHHTSPSNPLAYAVCNGQVLIQQDSNNANLVNILLKPNEQPNNDLPKIKYYIYRGVLKSTLTDGTDVVSGGNTLTKHIIDHNSITPQKVLGIELTGTNYNDSDPVDNAFYISKPDFELWKVYGGWSLGSFDHNGFGFEIVFENLGYEITFEVLRMNRHVIKVSSIGSTPTQAEAYEHKTKKQEILNFIDPCAFWGNLYSKVILARTSINSTDSDLIHDFKKKKKDEIYRDLIEGGTTGSPSNFYLNKNKIYLDIRNGFSDSINYFENYNDSVRISFVDDSSEPTVLFDYYSSGWPLLVIDSLPGGDKDSYIRISFPTSLIITPLVAVLCGERKIKLSEKIKKGKSQFKNLTNSIQDGYTEDSLFLISPNYDSGPVVSQYIKLKYLDQKLHPESQPINNVPFIRKTPFDYIFQPTALIQLFNTNNSLKINIHESEAYINNLESYGIDYTAKIGLAKDLGNTILFWALSKRNVKSRFKASNPSYSISSSSESTFDYFTEFILNSALPDKIKENLVVVSGNSIQLLEEEKSRSSFFKRKNDLDYNSEFYALILSDNDFDSIVNTANTNFTSIYKPYLFVSNEEEIFDDGDIPIIKVELTLKGLAGDGNGNIEIIEVPTGVTVYSNKISN